MPKHWFGTDGIRGVANVDLTPELALAAGRAAARALANGRPARLLVGRDTRESGRLLESALAAGISAAGGAACLAGVIPTPGVSRLVANGAFDGGVVISASHNAFADNGIKLFAADGKKLSDEREFAVEELLSAELSAACQSVVRGGQVGSIEDEPGAGARYAEELLGALEPSLSGLRVLLDCAQGATYQVAPLAFRAAGAEVEAVGTGPDGRNINDGCGSTHPGYLSSLVAQGDYQLGLAFDGDGDRVIAVDPTGEIVDGDQILTILGSWLKDQGRLRNDTVVVTSMSNLGFHMAMRERQVRVEVTDVGDRYVLERMEQVDAVLGGEQSGHIIYLDAGVTGDGMQTGLLLAHIVATSGRGLKELAAGMRRFPQVLLNVRVGEKERLRGCAPVWDAVRAEEEALQGNGRVVLRPSGTEPVIRVMVEAPTQDQCEAVARRLAGTVERALA